MKPWILAIESQLPALSAAHARIIRGVAAQVHQVRTALLGKAR